MTKTKLSEFREAVYQRVIWRPAAILDLMDALTTAGHVRSPVALSESPLFRRKFSSVYDALVHGELSDDLKTLFSNSQATDWETIAGYEVHAIDATPNERRSAETLADRGVLKAQQKVRVRVWHKLHFKRLAKVVGSVVCVVFLKEDGSPRYKRPLWLFWTGPVDVAPHDLCRIYLWRFAIEHLFRFLKQHLGLNSNRSSNLESLQRWMWIVALAYWQLLLMRETVQPNRPAWHPHKKDGQLKPLTPAQVQRSAQAFLLQSGTPAANTRPTGKGCGRQNGYRPPPRKRFDVVFKTKRTQNQPITC